MDIQLLIACASLAEGARVTQALQPHAACGVSSIHVLCISIEHACALASRTLPDVALLEMQPALQMLPALRHASPATRALLLYDTCTHLDIVEAVRLGAAGCVARSTPAALLSKAVRTAHAGGTWYGRESLVHALRSQVVIRTRTNPDTSMLTQREGQVLELIGSGLSNKEIGRRLEISDLTVKTHLHRVYSKLQQSGRFKAFLAQPRPGVDAQQDADNP